MNTVDATAVKNDAIERYRQQIELDGIRAQMQSDIANHLKTSSAIRTLLDNNDDAFMHAAMMVLQTAETYVVQARIEQEGLGAIMAAEEERRIEEEENRDRSSDPNVKPIKKKEN